MLEWHIPITGTNKTNIASRISETIRQNDTNPT